MADVFYNNTSAIFHNDTFAETEHDDHEADEHCHNYPSTEEIYFYVNVIVLLIIITLGMFCSCPLLVALVPFSNG